MRGVIIKYLYALFNTLQVRNNIFTLLVNFEARFVYKIEWVGCTTELTGTVVIFYVVLFFQGAFFLVFYFLLNDEVSLMYFLSVYFPFIK